MRQSELWASGRSLRWTIVLVWSLLAPLSYAAIDLYTVAVPLDPADPESRNNAYEVALNSVLVRVTGSNDEQQLLELSEIFPNPARYVLRYRPGPESTLEVSFDGDAIERVLRQTRQPIWDADRPMTLVWLAVDWGDGEREIIAADDALKLPDATRSIDRNRQLRERIEETAALRGIPVVFPLLDTEDRQNISFSEIWGGFDEQLLDASRRYGANSILVGRFRPDSPQQNRWTYYFGEERLGWQGEPEVVTNQLADELAAQFAVSGDAVLEVFTLTIDGVDSVVAYGTVQQLMDNLGVVEDFALQKVSGRRMQYSVQVYGGIDRLNKALELSGVLQPSLLIDDDGSGMSTIPDPNLLAFEYRP